MLKLHLLLAISIVVFYKSLFMTHGLPNTVNTRPISGRRYTKLMYLVLDGLRFDAFVPVNKRGRYYNRMPIAADPAINSRCFLTVAGIPTATTSRVVSLMTGTPANPLEILRAFSSRCIRMDSLVHRSPPDTSFFGDEFWPKSFERLAGCSAAMPSYSRFDQAAREDELMDGLMARIASASSSESGQFIFAHFNTLDTYGHAFGVDQDVIQRTLERWNAYLYRIYNAMDKDTLFVALSDHGVTDRGQHGGSSAEELASFSCFFTKDAPLDDNVLDDEQTHNYQQFMGKFYSIDKCNTADDWIQARQPYKIIHQDDIVVTIAYLLGVPPPYNSYGNLVPYISRDLNALKGLAALKEESPSVKRPSKRAGSDDVVSCEKYNYFLTEQVHGNLTHRSWAGGLIVLLLALYLLYSSRCVEALSAFAATFFVTAMVSHSMFAFASEDHLWLGALLAERPSLENLLALCFYIKMPGEMTMDRDRVNLCRRWGVLDLEKFANITGPVLLSGLFILSKACVQRPLWAYLGGNSADSAKECGLVTKITGIVNRDFVMELQNVAPQLYYIFYSMASEREDRELKISLLSADPSLCSLVAVHNRPINALYMLLFLRNLDTGGSSTSLYAALAFLPYCSNLDKTIQSIEYETFFVFTDDYLPMAAAVSALAYLVVPRMQHIARLYKCPPVRRRGFRFLNLVGLYVAFACAWAQFGHLTFQNFFCSRLLFVTFFAIIDILGLALLEMLIAFSNKQL